MDRKAKEFLFNLLNTPSPTGFESEEQRIWMTHVQPFADSVENDAYGNAWATLNGGAPAARIMLEAHADEIGFMIQNVTESGFLYVIRIGGSDRTIARSKRLTILGDKGPVSAVTGNTAIHIRDKENEKIPEVHELYLDIGANSREEVEERGIRVGHPAVYADTAEELFPGRLIGGPGMRMVSYRLEPSVAIVLDVTHATDSPGIDRNKHGSITLGNGPTVTHGSANHPMVVKRLISLANELHIPIQHEASSGTTGTDTDRVYQTKGGIPSALVSVPMRYMHSTVEMIDLVDVERCIQLLTHFVRSVTSKEEFIPKLL
jgi:endoglucanase